jgi:hypothetical protein
MGRYLGSWNIDDILRVHVQTSSVTTGAAADAESVPSWRVYEDDTITPVTTGSFSTLNAMTGFYVAAITLAAAIGYESGKTYAVRTAATVAGIIGADVHTFQIGAKVAVAPGGITAGSITDGALSASKFGAGFITAGSFSGNALAGMAVTLGSTTRATLVDEVWDEPKAGHTTADTYGEMLDATASSAATIGATAVAAIASAVTAGSIGAVTLGATSNAAIAAAVTAGSIGAVTVGATAAAAIAALVEQTVGATAAGAIADAVWDEPKAGHTTADTYGEYIDATLGALKAKTDLLFAGTGNSIAADIRYVNGVSVTGNGQSGTEWGPGA